MRPRQLLLEMWRAVAEYSCAEGAWKFGGRIERNSTSDAEQLLCLMY
ncbi:hypothetical protein, partial [Frankia sp. EI5c]